MKTGYERALMCVAACLIAASSTGTGVIAAEADFDQLRDKYYADHPGKGNFGDCGSRSPSRSTGTRSTSIHRRIRYKGSSLVGNAWLATRE